MRADAKLHLHGPMNQGAKDTLDLVAEAILQPIARIGVGQPNNKFTIFIRNDPGVAHPSVVGGRLHLQGEFA